MRSDTSSPFPIARTLIYSCEYSQYYIYSRLNLLNIGYISRYWGENHPVYLYRDYYTFYDESPFDREKEIILNRFFIKKSIEMCGFISYIKKYTFPRIFSVTFVTKSNQKFWGSNGAFTCMFSILDFHAIATPNPVIFCSNFCYFTCRIFRFCP